MKVSVQLEEGQSPEEAEEKLFKALTSQRSGQQHDADQFPDPAMEHQAKVMKRIYGLFFQKMSDEIMQELEKANGSKA